MSATTFYNLTEQPWVVIAICLVSITIALFFIRFFIMYWLKKWTSHTKFIFDSLLIASISKPLTLCTFIVLLTIIEQGLLIQGEPVASYISFSTINIILGLVAIILFFDHFFVGAINYYSKESAVIFNSQSIIKGIIRVSVLSVGALVLLGTLGISITPIIASLGITSLAVALALQPTLENFFSGVQLVIDKPIRVGDFIELESKEQGFVEKIGWRSTWVKMLPNNMIIIPNSQLSKSRISRAC